MKKNDREFIMKYRWYRNADPSNEWKREYVFQSDGEVTVREWTRSSYDEKFVITARGKKIMDSEVIHDLYEKCMKIIANQTGCENCIDSSDAELIIESYGMKISADRGLTDGSGTIRSTIQDFIEKLSIEWQ